MMLGLNRSIVSTSAFGTSFRRRLRSLMDASEATWRDMTSAK